MRCNWEKKECSWASKEIMHVCWSPVINDRINALFSLMLRTNEDGREIFDPFRCHARAKNLLVIQRVI